ncbi:complement C1q tumor necrosis factor-related protein 3-like [Ruditapes philippinarum]|uniref:complement C1q tumor necrosis factor-related protein 3-like n=1 Tax=Ruditapes philippinarum TaxID=129788 RepID=UPI00295B646A|nr:complement C1q tumor necrosis factor-related protein 3-like [Ruditapes philippinarum]
MLAFVFMTVVLIYPASTSPDSKGDVLNAGIIREIVSSFMETEGSDCRSLANHVADLSKEMKQQSIKMDDMVSIIATQSNDIRELKHKISIIEEDNERLRSLFNEENGKNNTTKQNDGLTNIESSKPSLDVDEVDIKSRGVVNKDGQKYSMSQRIRASSTGVVAFTAYLDHALTGLNPGMTIKCNIIITNHGHGYNTFTGIFTAPVSGIYFITYTINCGMKKTNIRLMKDGVNIVDAVVHADPYSGSYRQTMATNSVVIDVTAGQSIWLETIYDHDAELISLEDYRYVTFTGFLLV